MHTSCGYRIVELDQIIREEVIKPLNLQNEGKVFEEIYKKQEKTEWLRLFVEAVTREVTHLLKYGHKVVPDGAVVNPVTLRQLFEALPSATFFFFHPENLTHYVRNLTERFLMTSEHHNSGLPLRFWKLLDEASCRKFYQTRIITPDIAEAIKTYAESSRASSEERLSELQKHLKHIVVVKV